MPNKIQNLADKLYTLSKSRADEREIKRAFGDYIKENKKAPSQKEFEELNSFLINKSSTLIFFFMQN